MERAGFPIQLVAGDPLNIKVTTREDLLLAEAILRSRKRHSAA
jgi:2-C-methyl-D-erythritol 4-phosphate cytidylyltransferase